MYKGKSEMMNKAVITSAGIHNSSTLNDINKPVMRFAAINNMLVAKTIISHLFLNTTQNMESLDSAKK